RDSGKNFQNTMITESFHTVGDSGSTNRISVFSLHDQRTNVIIDHQKFGDDRSTDVTFLIALAATHGHVNIRVHGLLASDAKNSQLKIRRLVFHFAVRTEHSQKTLSCDSQNRGGNQERFSTNINQARKSTRRIIGVNG